MSQRVPATEKIKESSLKGPSCSGSINRRLPYAKKVLCLQPVTSSEKTLNGTGLKTNHPVGFLFEGIFERSKQFFEFFIAQMAP